VGDFKKTKVSSRFIQSALIPMMTKSLSIVPIPKVAQIFFSSTAASSYIKSRKAQIHQVIQDSTLVPPTAQLQMIQDGCLPMWCSC
jgi:hypothetical protein